MTVGAAGGPKIITQVLLTIIRHLDFGNSLREAVAASRFHHQWRPDSVLVEESLDPSLVESLQRLGHEVVTTPAAGVTQAVGVDLSGVLLGVGDPRVPGKVGRATQQVAESAP